MGRDYFIGGKYAFSDNKIIKCVDPARADL